MKHRILRPLTVLALAALMLCTSSGTLGVVLCYGEDGHVATEPAFNGTCGSRSGAADGVSRELAFAVPPDDHCGPCGDVPLLQDAARASRPMPGGSTLVAISIPWCIALAAPGPASWKSGGEAQAKSPILASLRSVVLLT